MKYTKYHVQKGRLVKVPNDNKFGRGDTYIIDAGYAIYIWVGEKATTDEKVLAAFGSVLKDLHRMGEAKIIHVEQGREPKEFLELFCNKIEVTDQDTESILKKVQLEKHEYKLFHIRADDGQIYFTEVEKSKDSLNSDDVFLLDTFDKIYIWRGKNASGMEKFQGTFFAKRYDEERVGVQDIILIDEGNEPEEFIEALEK